jgi:hypothetical protein
MRGMAKEEIGRGEVEKEEVGRITYGNKVLACASIS